MFDDDEVTERDKTFNDFYNFKFKMQKSETFETFIIRFTIVITFLTLNDSILIISLRQKFIKRLNENIKHLIFIKFYKNFVDDVKIINLQNRHDDQRSDCNYSGFNSLIYEKKIN